MCIKRPFKLVADITEYIKTVFKNFDEILKSQTFKKLKEKIGDRKNARWQLCKALSSKNDQIQINRMLRNRLVKALLSNKKRYIIVTGYSGVGKTTVLNQCFDKLKEIDKSDDKKYKVQYLDARNKKDNILLKNSHIKKDKTYLFLDNCNNFNKNSLDGDNELSIDLNMIKNYATKKFNGKIIIACRNSDIEKDSSHTIINFNKYKFRAKNKCKYKMLYKKLPECMRVPFYFKLLNCLDLNDKQEKDIKEFCEQKNLNEDTFVNIFLDKAFKYQFTEKENKILILFCMIVRNMNYRLSELKNLLRDVYKSDKTHSFETYKSVLNPTYEIMYNKLIKLLKNNLLSNFITKINNIDKDDSEPQFALHSILSDYYVNKYKECSYEEKFNLLTSIEFPMILSNILWNLDQNKNGSISDTIIYLEYAYNIISFYRFDHGICTNSCSIETIKVLVNLQNIYAWTLLKISGACEKLVEAKELQKSTIGILILKEKTWEKSYGRDKYLYLLSQFYNVYTKINLALALNRNIGTNGYYNIDNDYLNTAINHCKTFNSTVNNIKNINDKILRKSYFTTTLAIILYKIALFPDKFTRDLIAPLNNLVKTQEEGEKGISDINEKILLYSSNSYLHMALENIIYNIKELLERRFWGNLDYNSIIQIIENSNEKKVTDFYKLLNPYLSVYLHICIVETISNLRCHTSILSDKNEKFNEILDFLIKMFGHKDSCAYNHKIKYRETLLLDVFNSDKLTADQNDNLKNMQSSLERHIIEDCRFDFLKELVMFIKGFECNKDTLIELCGLYGVDSTLFETDFNKLTRGQRDDLENKFFVLLSM